MVFQAQFDDGTVVEFDKAPTQQDVEEAYSQVKGKKSPTVPSPLPEAEPRTLQGDAMKASPALGKALIQPAKTTGSQIMSAAKGGLDQANAGYQKVLNGSPLQKAEGVLGVGAGLANAAFSPLAPLNEHKLSSLPIAGSPFAGIGTSISGIIKKEGDVLGGLPAVQKFANSKAGETTSRVAENVGNAATIAQIAAPYLIKGKIGAPNVGKAEIPTPKQPKIVAKRLNELQKLDDAYASVRKVTEKHNAKGIDSKSLLAQTDLLKGAVDNTGTLRTENARTSLNEFIKPYEKVVSKNLEREGVSYPLAKIADQMKHAVDTSGLEGASLDQAYAKVDAEINGLKRRTDSAGNIMLSKVQDAKISKYRTIDYMNEGAKIADKAIARTLKKVVEDNTRSVDVQALNGELQKHYAVLDLLEKLDGRKVEGGRLGKYFASTIGAVVGGHFGPLGSIAGAELGARLKGAGLKSNALGNPEGTPLSASDAMKSAVARGEQPRLALPAPRDNVTVRNNVPIEMGYRVPDEPQVNMLGNRNQPQMRASTPETISNMQGETLPKTGARQDVSPPNSIIDKAKKFYKDSGLGEQRGFVKIPKKADIHPDDLHLMETYIDHARIKGPLSDAEFGQVEKLAEHFGVSMDKSPAQIANAFEDILSGKKKVPDTVLQPRRIDGKFDKKKALPSLAVDRQGATSLPKASGDTAKRSGMPTKQEGKSWPTTASKRSTDTNTSTGNAPTERGDVSAQKADTSVPFGGKEIGRKNFFDLDKVVQNDITSEMVERYNGKVRDYAIDNYIGEAVSDLPLREVDPRTLKAQFAEQNRATSPKVVDAYVQMLKNGSEAPPVLVNGNKFVDGGHRVEAAIKANQKSIKVVDIADVMDDAKFRDYLAKNEPEMFEKLSPSIPKETGPVQKAIDYVKNLPWKSEGGFIKNPLPRQYAGEKNLTTSILDNLEGKTTVSKQYIQDLTNRPELKQAERDLVRQLLSQEGDKVEVKDFAEKIAAELLPLKTVGFGSLGDLKKLSAQARTLKGSARFESVALPDGLRGPVAAYGERIYESPIKTSAANVHFGNEDIHNYFAHTRIEDLPAKSSERFFKKQGGGNFSKGHVEDLGFGQEIKSGGTRRVIELQSDLFQKGRLEAEGKAMGDVYGYEEGGKVKEIPAAERQAQLSKLEPYRNTWHERVIREEIKQAAKDGKTKLQFPTGETAMKIEGLGERNMWFEASDDGLGNSLSKDSLSVGKEIGDGRGTTGNRWIITDVLGDGKFKAVPKREVERLTAGDAKSGVKTTQDDVLEALRNTNATETFDISGKVDTENPIFKFYEKEVGRYLQKFNAKRITDAQGVQWYEVPITKDMKNRPMGAFSGFGANLPRKQ